jgi:glycosyltransferase involved in cell wall biosynthesis
VTFISSHAHGGGSERYLELLLGELGPDWIRGVVALQDGPFADRLRELGYPVEVVPTPARLGMIPAAMRLRRVLRAQRPAVVHANGVKAALVAVIATRGTGIPVIWVKHDFSRDGWLARVIGAASTEVVAVAEAITATFGERSRARARTRVVPNGIPELDLDAAAGRATVAELVGDADAPVVSLIGRLDSAKGQLELVEAAPAVLEREPRARFLLVGGEDPNQPGFGDRVRRRVAELGLEDAVVLAGHRSDAVELMAGSTVIVMPSVPNELGGGKEACPFALLEAMAARTPVVAYASGGIPEVLGDCGRLVPEADRAALADAIAGLLADAAERDRLAACAHERVRTRFRLETTVDAMRERYAAVAGG